MASSSNNKNNRRHTTAGARTSTRKFYMNITINAFIGSMLAVIGTFLLFFNGQDATPLCITIIGVFCVCIGAVGIVNFFRKKDDNGSLVVSILQVLIGVLFIVMANTIKDWIYLVIGILLIAYGIYLLIISRKSNTLGIVLGILLIVVGILILLWAFNANWQWLRDWGYIIIGIAAYCGAAFFLFFH